MAPLFYLVTFYGTLTRTAVLQNSQGPVYHTIFHSCGLHVSLVIWVKIYLLCKISIHLNRSSTIWSIKSFFSAHKREYCPEKSTSKSNGIMLSQFSGNIFLTLIQYQSKKNTWRVEWLTLSYFGWKFGLPRFLFRLIQVWRVEWSHSQFNPTL